MNKDIMNIIKYYYYKECFNDVITEINNFKYTTVATKTYKTIIEENHITNLDLMVLDVEGNEPKAMKGMLGCKVLPAVFCVETNHCEKSEINSLLKELGYKFDYKSKINSIFIKV